MDLSRFMPLLSLIQGGQNPEPMMRQMFGDAMYGQVSQLVSTTPADQRAQLIQQICQQRGIPPAYVQQIAQMLGLKI